MRFFLSPRANKFINVWQFYSLVHTSRPSTGCKICIETFTKWLPDKFNAFNCPNGTNNSYGITPISAIDNVLRLCNSCNWNGQIQKKTRKTTQKILIQLEYFWHKFQIWIQSDWMLISIWTLCVRVYLLNGHKWKWENMVEITWNASRISYKSIWMFPLMLSVCNFFTGSTLADSNFTNLLYERSRYVKFDRFTNAPFVTLASRFRDKSGRWEKKAHNDGSSSSHSPKKAEMEKGDQWNIEIYFK